MRQPMRRGAVRGEEQHAFGEVVEPTDVGEPGHARGRDRTPSSVPRGRAREVITPAGLCRTNHSVGAGASMRVAVDHDHVAVGIDGLADLRRRAVDRDAAVRRPALRPCVATARPRAPARAGCASARTSDRAVGSARSAIASSSARGSSSRWRSAKYSRKIGVVPYSSGRPSPLAAADDVDQAALVQRLEHAAHRDAADLLDLGAADRLPIGDDRERLERRGAEPRGRAASCARSIASVYSARVRICQPPPSSTSSTPWPSTS